MFTRKKEKKNPPKRDKLFISINIKENCKTESGVTQLLLQNHLVMASGKMLLFLISGQQDCWGCTAQGTRVCSQWRGPSGLPTGSSHPRGKLCKDTPLGSRESSQTVPEPKLQGKCTQGCAAGRSKQPRKAHCSNFQNSQELVSRYIDY